jgi:hypothetical protein
MHGGVYFPNALVIDIVGMEGFMKYRYTTMYSIIGFSLPTGVLDLELINDSKIASRAFLTSRPDIHTFEGDRGLAVGHLLLRGISYSRKTKEEYKRYVANEVEETQVARKKKFGDGPYLVITCDGETPNINHLNLNDFEDFFICMDGFDKSKIRSRCRQFVSEILNTLALLEAKNTSIRKVTDCVVFIQEDGKPIYSYTLTGGTASVYVSKPLADEQLNLLRELYRLVSEDTEMQRVRWLFRSSFEAEEDPLRSFLAAWSALEIFVNKSFQHYENTLFDGFRNKEYPEIQRKFLYRIREVMKDKYRLADKFAAICFQLSPGTADEDLQIFMDVKKIRDDLIHGNSVDESLLPIKSIHGLTSKYLRLHFEYIHRKNFNQLSKQM